MTFDKSKEEFLNLPIGTVILGKRYKTEEEKNKIANGHQIGPFLIIGTKGLQKVVLFCTSQNLENQKNNNFNYFKIVENALPKTTYVDMRKCSLLDYEQYLKTVGYLCKSEIKEIYKRLEYQNCFNNQEYFECPINSIPITPGDIIYKENNAYLIYEKDNQNLRAFLYNKKSRKCNYKERYTITNSEGLTRYRIGSITLEELRKVLNLYKKDLEEAKEFKEISEKEIEIESGTIIYYGDEYYYVNYCFPDKLLCFLLRRNDFSQIKENLRICVGNKEYYVFMKDSKDIQIKEDFKIIATASQEEKEFIRELKKRK